MATPADLLGLGLPPLLARSIGMEVVASVVSQGATAASATPLVGDNRTYLVTASNSGSGLLMPAVGGDQQFVKKGDKMIIMNLLSASVVLYFANTALGSAVTIYVDGGSVVGSTGVSAATGKAIMFQPITASTWIGFRSA